MAKINNQQISIGLADTKLHIINKKFYNIFKRLFNNKYNIKTEFI